MIQYLLGFFNAIFIVTVLFFFTGSQKKNLGDIVVTSIEIIDPLSGKKTIIDSGSLSLINANGKIKGVIGSDDRSGYLYLMNHNNYRVFRAGSLYGEGFYGEGYLDLLNQYGDYIGWGANGKESGEHYK